MGTTASTPESDHLFKVCDERKTHYLLEEKAQTFHHTVSKIVSDDLQITTIQTDGCGINHHTYEETRRVIQGKTKASTEISQGKEGPETHLKR